jgi:hypothetical protein
VVGLSVDRVLTPRDPPRPLIKVAGPTLKGSQIQPTIDDAVDDDEGLPMGHDLLQLDTVDGQFIIVGSSGGAAKVP